MAALVNFEPSLPDLVDALPSWWATQLPGSELAILLQVVGELMDDLAAAADTIAADMALTTATADGLQSEWALLWGLQNEQLPPTRDALQTYIKQRAGDDGSTNALLGILVGILSNPSNAAGTVLTFPASGGLTFPADGSGLVLFETGVAPISHLVFPGDGSGLTFPASGGITFPSQGWVEVIQSLSDYTLTVQVKNWLSFDRAAFGRAVQRARPSHFQKPTIVEVA